MQPIDRQVLEQMREIDRILRAATGDMARTIRRYRMRHGMKAEFERVKPMLRKQLLEVRRELQEKIIKTLEKGTKDAWELANRENDIMLKAYTKGQGVPKALMASMQQVNIGALEAFLGRKSAGMSLSQNVWQLTQKYMGRIETYLGAGITTGKSASRIATDLKKYLKKPDALFRRVRGADGKLHLSKAAKAYHPGQGTYRSAYQNAKRLAATETNMAYHLADYERRQQLPFVTGIEVHVNPDGCEMCQAMAGKYPKDFVFTPFHPKCRCFTTDELLPEDKFQDYLNTGKVDGRYGIKTIPDKAQGWIGDNKERLIKTREALKKKGGYAYWMDSFDKDMELV